MTGKATAIFLIGVFVFAGCYQQELTKAEVQIAKDKIKIFQLETKLEQNSVKAYENEVLMKKEKVARETCEQELNDCKDARYQCEMDPFTGSKYLIESLPKSDSE